MLVATERVPNKTECIPESVNVAGVPIVPFEDYDQALAYIQRVVESGRKTFWIAINPQKCYRAWSDPSLLDVLRRADVCICDGVGVSLASRILHGRGINRCTGCDLFFKLLPFAADKQWGVFLLGASGASNAKACSNLRQRFPNLKIVGSQDGYFEDSDAVIERINAPAVKRFRVFTKKIPGN